MNVPHDFTTFVSHGPAVGGPALHGITGEIADLATHTSEADPIAVAITHLVWAGAMFGRSSYQNIGDAQHHGRLFAAIVGESSVARKGTSTEGVRKIWTAAEDKLDGISGKLFPLGQQMKIRGGLSTGEGLIYEIRDPQEPTGNKKLDKELDPGEPDKRLLIIESELAQIFKVGQRSGNTLSVYLRHAWDGIQLAPMTKTSRISATAPHICIVGHITAAELRALMSDTDVLNGLANRFLWMWSRRPKLIAYPEPIPEIDVVRVGNELARLTMHAHEIGKRNRKGELAFTHAAMEMWVPFYAELSIEQTGIIGPIMARGPAYVRRLAAIYALLDGMDEIDEQHLGAAMAIYRYSSDSAAHIFGAREVDPRAQQLLDFLEDGPKARTTIRDVCFQRHLQSPDLDRILTDLIARRRITEEIVPTKGRPAKIYRRSS